MSTVARQWRFVLEQLRVNMLSAMEYRVSFLMQVFFMMLNDVLLLFFWWVLFQRFDQVAGWRQDDIFLLYAIGAGAFGLAFAVFGNATRLSSLIADGQLDYYLALPKDVWLNVLISRSSASTVGDVLFGVTLCVLLLGFSASLLMALFFMCLAALVYVSFVTIVHSLSFYIGNAEQIATVMTDSVLSFGLYPISLYSISVRVVLYTVIPAAFLSYVPVTLVRSFSWPLFAALCFAAVFGVWLSRRVFYAGLKRYESGNLVAPRM